MNGLLQLKRQSALLICFLLILAALGDGFRRWRRTQRIIPTPESANSD